MKKLLFPLCLLALLFVSCKEDPTIVGKWEVTESTEMSTDQFTIVYEFFENKDMNCYMGDSLVDEDMAWAMRGDTLLMYNKYPDEYSGMPGVMLVEKLTREEMQWYALIPGVRVWLKRI